MNSVGTNIQASTVLSWSIYLFIKMLNIFTKWCFSDWVNWLSTAAFVMAYKLKFCQTILIYLSNDLPKSLHPPLLGNVFFPLFLDNNCLWLLRLNNFSGFLAGFDNDWRVNYRHPENYFENAFIVHHLKKYIFLHHATLCHTRSTGDPCNFVYVKDWGVRGM